MKKPARKIKTLDEKLIIRVDSAMARQVRNAGRRDGVSDAQIVRRALREHFEPA